MAAMVIMVTIVMVLMMMLVVIVVMVMVVVVDMVVLVDGTGRDDVFIIYQRSARVVFSISRRE